MRAATSALLLFAAARLASAAPAPAPAPAPSPVVPVPVPVPAAAPSPSSDSRVQVEVDNCPAPPAELTPDQVKAQASEHFDRGEILYEQGDYTRAVSDLVWAYCMVPRYYTILKSIGQAYERALDYDKAIAYFELYVERIPADAVRATPCDPDPQADRVAMSSRIKVLRELPARVQIDTPVDANIELAAAGGVAGRQEVSGAPFDVLGGLTYTATIRAPNYVTQTRQIITHIGRTTTEYVELQRQKGTVRLRVAPADAKIELDNLFVGTGAAEIHVDAKHYTLRIEAPDHVPLETGLDVLPARDTARSFELAPVPQFGRRQLLAYAAVGGTAVGAAGLGVSGDKTLTAVGAVAGGAGGAILAYYGTPDDIPLGTSSLTITSSMIGGVAGFDLATIGSGKAKVIDNSDSARVTRAVGGAGLAVGAVTGYFIGEKTKVLPGDAAVVNSGALWGAVAGHLIGFTFDAPNSTIGGLGLVGMAMGTTGGVLLTRYYTVSRKHAALIDASGVAGMITGVATANLVFNQQATKTDTSVLQERTADFALGGLAVGLISGGILTRMIDLPKLPVGLRTGAAQGVNGKASATFGLGGEW